MSMYLLKRLGLLLPTLIGVSMVVFSAVRFLPGDIVDQIAGEAGLNSRQGTASAELRAQLRERYSLGGPIHKQYAEWTGELLSGNLGTSLASGRSITSELRNRMPVTFELGIFAMMLSMLIAVPVGVISAVRQNTVIDYLARSMAIGFLSVPSFWLSALVIVYGFQWFRWTPPLRYTNLWDDPSSNLTTIWVPAVILGAGLSGSVMRLTRSAMLEVLRQDYIRTARSKGLNSRAVIVTHALRNAIVPVVTVIGLQIPLLVGGTVILESIFSLPGMGSYLLTALNVRDYPVVQAVVLIAASVVVVTNVLVDLSYALIDPRIRYS